MKASAKSSVCDQEAIHSPGAIQPHGALLAAHMDDWRITHASANLADFLGQPAAEVLGLPLEAVLGEKAFAAIQGIEPSNGVGATILQQELVGASGAPMNLRAHRLNRQVCIDIEPADTAPVARSPFLLTQPVLDSFKHAADRADLCALAVRGLATLTGYDRVMVYRFADTGEGEVVAELCAGPIAPCLGLRFPASDIPAQARRHYVRQSIGMVPDAGYVPVPLLTLPSGDRHGPDRLHGLDLTYSQLRSVSPMHRNYMRNMATVASLTIGLSDGHTLWGMIVCHHATPRVPPIDVRAACYVIGQVVSLLYGSLTQAELSTERLRRNTMLRKVVDRLSTAAPLAEALQAVEQELLHLVDATGALVRLSGSTLMFGRTPPKDVAERAARALQAESGGEIVAVDDMVRRYPQFGDAMQDGCGALMLPLSYSSDDAILWFRPQQWQTVNWGGDPRAAPTDPATGGPLPRASFTPWQEVVKHCAVPWTQADVASAAEVARRVEAEIVRRTRAELVLAQDASRAKSRFLAAMTHELRTPLHGILGYAQLLSAEGGLNDLQSLRVQAMMGASTHLLDMINRVLELSEIESEQVKLSVARFDPAALATACLRMVRPAAEARGLALSVHIGPGLPAEMSSDPTRLRQVLLNLLGNAVKFTVNGFVELRLSATPAGGALRLTITDTGPGIPVEQRPRLFQDFERLETSGLEATEGAGLGLALSARLASLMGGTIGFTPNPAGGSIFWMELPFESALFAGPAEPHGANVQPDVQPHVQPRAAAAMAPRAGLHVLIVDDIAINREIAESFLRSAGHEVTLAASGAAAVAAAAAMDFDVVLMDVRMPGMDGLEATRRIRALGGRRGAVPVVAVTAQAFADQVETCRAAGMYDHLAKPFGPDMLHATVMRAAARRDAAAPSATPPAPYQAAMTSGAEPLLGLELAVVDRAIFERTVGYLSPASAATYLQTITQLGLALQAGLRRTVQEGGGSPDLMDSAHTMAGSAGMFGFDRVANLSRRFEHALQTGAAELADLSRSLDAAIDQTLQSFRTEAA